MKEKSYQSMEETELLKKENEELKEVLSAVQLDLEARTEVDYSSNLKVHTIFNDNMLFRS